MGCETPTIKYAVFLFSTICAILGIAVVVVNLLDLQNHGDAGRKICIFIVLLGSIAFLIPFLGCCGAVRENVYLTWTYAVCLLILIIGNAVIIFGYLSEIDGETEARNAINSAWTLQLNRTDVMSHIQTTHHCCGINNSHDYINYNMTIPNSCFVGGDYDKSTILFSEGCLSKLIAINEATEHWITIFVWSIFSVEMMAFVSACILAITFTNQQRRARY